MPSETDFAEASDATVAMGIARWREEALAEAYHRHSPAVYGLARRVLRDDAVAEEIVQEVFLRLWNEPERYDPERGSLRSFLLAMTHGRSVDALRAESSRRQREEREARAAGGGSGYDVAREVSDQAVAAQVRDVVGTLPVDERRAVELAYFGGHTYKEVAAILGQPEGTVKSRIRAALRRMHSELSATGVSDGGDGGSSATLGTGLGTSISARLGPGLGPRMVGGAP
jgi:RNA polymerase sigma-70 factor (ECF subfamily)